MPELESTQATPTHLVVPDLGVGAGLRVPHFAAILETLPEVGFFEAISDNFIGVGGRPAYYLDAIGERYPLVLHGVALSIGGPDEPDPEYLRELKALAKRTRAHWVSDHVCWGTAGGVHLHDLLPLPFTEEALRRVVRRARIVQDYLELPFALENTSSYAAFSSSTMSEWEFVNRLVTEADIGLLLDVNNIFVSAHNHGFSADEYLRGLPLERTLQIHMAGHSDMGKYLLDTHRGPMCEEVLELYTKAVTLTGARSTLVEWDDHIPELPVLLGELKRVERAREAALQAQLFRSGAR